jgi:hypothetical protein
MIDMLQRSLSWVDSSSCDYFILGMKRYSTSPKVVVRRDKFHRDILDTALSFGKLLADMAGRMVLVIDHQHQQGEEMDVTR